MSQRPYCPYCYSRGFNFFWPSAAGRGVGKPVKFDCDHCSAEHYERNPEQDAMDAHYVKALAWFKTSKAPDGELILSHGVRVVDPEAYWDILRRALASDYCTWPHALRSVIVELYERMAVAEEL